MAETAGGSGSNAAAAERLAASLGLSRKFKDSFKLALSLVIATGISLWMDWGHSYWSALAVIMCSFTASGDSLNKGLLRMGGTLAAVFVVLLVVGLTPQDRWMFVFLISLWVFLCTYMMGGPKAYFWQVGGFVAPILATSGGVDPATSFEIVILRSQQTGLGIVVFSVVSYLLWPVTSRGPFEAAITNVIEMERQAVAYILRLMRGAPKEGGGEALGGKAAPLLGQLPLMLDGAAVDSGEIRGKRRSWRLLLGQLVELREAAQRWHSSTADARKLDLETRLPSLGHFGAEIDRRFQEILAMMQDQDPGAPPRTVDPGSSARLDGLSHFERAVLVACVAEMRRIDQLTAALFSRVAHLRGRAGGEDLSDPPRPGPALDPDRFLSGFRCFVTLWSAYLVVIYVPSMPGASLFLTLSVSMTLALTTMPQVSPTIAQKPVFMGLAVIALIYVFVMPELSTFDELAIVLFAAAFGVAYKFPLPMGFLYRMTWLPMLVVILGVSNQQTYSFTFVGSVAVSVLMLIWLVTLLGYLPVSQQPKDRFRAQLRRFFRSAGFLLGASQWADRARGSRVASYRERFHVNEVSTIPSKMLAWCPAIRALSGPGGNTDAQPLVTALQWLRQRIVEVHATREVIRLSATDLPDSLRRELADWRNALEQLFGMLHVDPRALDSASLDERLDAGVRRLEAEVSNALEDRPSFDEQELYRLLAALRDVSTGLVEYARQAEAFDWSRFYETRF